MIEVQVAADVDADAVSLGDKVDIVEAVNAVLLAIGVPELDSKEDAESVGRGGAVSESVGKIDAVADTDGDVDCEGIGEREMEEDGDELIERRPLSLLHLLACALTDAFSDADSDAREVSVA